MGKLVCTIEMDKIAGLTVTIDNPDDSIKQTVTMNGTTIVLKVVGGDATSTITQDQKKISIACTQFELKATETVDVSSGKASTYKSDDTMTLQSAKDMTQKSDANVSVSGQKIAVEGQTEVAITGASQNKLTLASAGATLAAVPKLAMSGTQVEVKADATFNAEASGIATVKGAMTNIQGDLVNIG
jgi:hypothetical protein